MANYFDKYDQPSRAPAPGNYFDKYDPPAPSRDEQASSAVKEYAPHVAVGIGKDLTEAMAGILPGGPIPMPFLPGKHVGAVGNLFGIPGLGSPETYQHAIEGVTGKWPQASEPGERRAEYVGRVLPAAPAIAYGLYESPLFPWILKGMGLGTGYSAFRMGEDYLTKAFKRGRF